MDRQLEPKWILCSEKLPEKQDEYMVTWKAPNKSRSFLSIAEYESDYGDWILDDYIPLDAEVTAWMPLPEPYEPQGSEGQR